MQSTIKVLNVFIFSVNIVATRLGYFPIFLCIYFMIKNIEKEEFEENRKIIFVTNILQFLTLIEYFTKLKMISK